MREIKFRGIYPHSGQFFYGYFINSFPDTPRIVSDNNSTPIKRETLGQSTGLQDCNGDEIYEGDILKFPTLYETPEMSPTYHSKAQVVFLHGAFYMQLKDEEITPDTYTLSHEIQSYDGGIEIIGNIHQNPELSL